MTLTEYKLPTFPCVEDVWDKLGREKRPIIVYGMGNGADKLFDRFEKYGIRVSEIMASDGFVRGHSFRGFKVKSFSEIKAEYTDFVIVLSFASNRKEVIDMLAGIDSEYEMYVPDMPIADALEYFDREFYNTHYEEILRVYNELADEKSKMIYSAVLNFRISGRLKYLMFGCSEKEEMYSLLNFKEIKTVIDAGAYNGDTAKEAIDFFPNLKRIYAIEPDGRNYKKLVKFAEVCGKEIITRNAAVFKECGKGVLMGSGNRNSSLTATASYQHSDTECEFISIDSLGACDADYIKYDVEGSEYEALLGSVETIKKSKPALLVSLYHRSRDIFFLPEYVKNSFEGYKLFVRRMPSVPAWELNLIALPIE